MKALEVSIHGHRVCLAGVGDDGVLHAVVNLVFGPGREEDCFLQVGGLDFKADEHLRWECPSIGVGAEVLMRVVEAEAVDAPNEHVRYEKKTCVDQYRKHLGDCSEWLTPDERRQLLEELIAELKAADAGPVAATNSGGIKAFPKS